MIRFGEERPPVSAEELAAAEERLAQMGLRIPPSYRAFLAERDWGRPVERDFTFRRGDDPDSGNLVEWFLGLAPVRPPGMNLLDVARALTVPGRMPAGVLPIAQAGGGDKVCLDGREGRDGPVLFWDREEEPEEPEDPSNLYFVAPDLASFLDGLTELPLLPAEPGWLPFDWRRLLGRRR